MDIKMIAVDLDGTLLCDDKTISARTVETLMKCRSHGIRIIYATARGKSAFALVPPDILDGDVQMNGAVAYANDICVYKRDIQTVSVRDMLLAADEAGIQIAVERADWTYANFTFPDEWELIFRENYEVTDFKTLDINAEKIWAMPTSEAQIDLLKAHLPKGLYLVTTRDDSFTMIMHEEARKANAVLALAKHWGISPEQIVAFGDDVNDLDMLEKCGTGVAMGNAVDEVKAVADYVCDTNENDGIAKWIEEHVLG